MNPQEIFDQMAANLNADAAKGMNSTIQFNLSGDDGGQWYVTIKDGKAEVNKGAAAVAEHDPVDVGTGLRRHDHWAS